MSRSDSSQAPGPFAGFARLALWLKENPRTWLTRMAVGAGVLAGMSVVFAAVWAALLPPWQSTTSVWVWAAVAAVYFSINVGLLLINAAGRMPGWLAFTLAAGGLFTSLGVFVTFVIALMSTETGVWLGVIGCVVMAVVQTPLTLALMWPMGNSMRPWLYRHLGEDHPPGTIGRD